MGGLARLVRKSIRPGNPAELGLYSGGQYYAGRGGRKAFFIWAQARLRLGVTLGRAGEGRNACDRQMRLLVLTCQGALHRKSGLSGPHVIY